MTRFDQQSCDTKPMNVAATANRLFLHHAKGCLKGNDDAKVRKSCNEVAQVEQLDCSLAKVIIKKEEPGNFFCAESRGNSSTATS